MQANVLFAPYIGYENLLFADYYMHGASPEQLRESLDRFRLCPGITMSSASLG